jgi:hypothetical protein
MKWYAKYSFKMDFPYNLQQLIIHEHIGVIVPNFSQRWISVRLTKHPRTKIRSSVFKDMAVTRFTYALLLENNMYIGLNSVHEMPDFCYGYFGEDAVLIHLERNKYGITKATIWFFEGMIQQTVMLYEDWVSAQLELDW